MPTLPQLAPRLRRLLAPDGAGTADADLLRRYVASGDAAAFEAIVRRHGPMVLGVCRRLLRGPDAEDAFQATFLVLVRKAACVSPGLLPNWLHGVARQTAIRARAASARRGRRERAVADVPEPAAEPPRPEPDLRPLLDEELARLPAKNRAAIVTCFLEGLTHKEAASRLGWPVGTVASRLSRGRALLARRLSRRGVTALGGAALAPRLPTGLAAAAGGAVDENVVALTQGVLKAMSMSKLKSIGAVCVVAVALAVGAALGMHKFAPEAVAAAPPKPPGLTLRQAVIGSLRREGFRVTDSGGKLRVVGGRVTGLEAERVAASAILNVEVAYWRLVQSRQQLACREEAVATSQETLGATEARKVVGTASVADLYQARGQRDLFREQHKQATEQVVEDEKQLRHFLGLTERAGPPLIPGDTPTQEARKPNWDLSVEEAMRSRPELRMTRARIPGGQALLIAEKVARGAMGGSLLDDIDRVVGPASHVTWRGYRLRYALRSDDRVSREEELRSMLVRDVEIHKDQESKVVRYLGHYFRKLSLDHDQIRATRVQRESFGEQLKARQDEYLKGRGTLDILLEAHRFLVEARCAEHASVVSYNNAIACFEYAKGSNLKRHGVVMESVPTGR